MANKIIKNTLTHCYGESTMPSIPPEPDKSKSISELSRQELWDMLSRLRDEVEVQNIIKRLKQNAGERDTFEKPMVVDTKTSIQQLYHHGIPGQKWGIRRFQRPDGSLTPKGQARLDKKDNKWASTKGEKIKTNIQKKVSKDMDKFAKTELEISYTPNGRLSSSTILQYNNKMASLMNDKVSGIQAPSGRVLKFVAKRGEIGVHTAIADSGYDLNQLQKGVFKSGKVAYKKENLIRGGD